MKTAGEKVGKWESENQDPLTRLSAAQLHILQLIGQGKMTKEIAAELQISEKGVEYHRARIYTALNLRSVGEAVAFSLSHLPTVAPAVH